MTSTRLIISGLVTLLFGLICTPLVRSTARGLGLVAPPRPDRWHQTPTAILGGVSIYLSFVLGFLIFAPRHRDVYPILAAATILFVIGLIDDLVQARPHLKLVLQFAAAAGTVYFGLHLPWTTYKPLNDLVTIFWLVGITNAMNLLDNMDGLAAGIAVIACIFLMITFLWSGQVEEAALPALLAGALTGFLVFNFHPASIFMGDCGSMFIGFMLAGTALLSDYGRTRNLGAVLLTPVLILLIPIFDTSVVTVSRKLAGRPISQGGRDHTSHRMVALGISERGTVLLFYSFGILSGALALMVRLLNADMILLLIPLFALMVLFVGLYLGKVQIYQDANPPEGKTILHALVDFSYKRRVFEVLLDVVLVVLAYYGAYMLRYEGNPPSDQVEIFVRALPIVIVVELPFFLIFGVYRGFWRYLGIKDLISIVKSVFAGSAASAFVVLAMHRFVGPSRAVMILNALLLLFFMGTSRLSFHLLRALIAGKSPAQSDARPVIIYGAGDGGELLIREILNNPRHGYVPLGFIDDDIRKSGKLIHGCEIFHSRELPELIRKHGIKEVLVSTLKIPESNLEALRNLGISPRRMNMRIEGLTA